ncbi:MAG: M23 family metallopeptidase [Gemmatimonadota bacterium]
MTARRISLATSVLLTVAVASSPALWSQEPTREPIEAVLLHPIVAVPFMCGEHAEGELSNLGDVYGKDCMVVGTDTTRAADRRIPSLFERDGLENEDWFGWEVELLAPCDGTVIGTSDNPVTNRPGRFPERGSVEPASEVRFACADGTRVVYAHVRDVRVGIGDSIAAGDVVAAIGNNAVSKAPHVHLGAWRGDTPLQIRFDLRALGALRRSPD